MLTPSVVAAIFVAMGLVALAFATHDNLVGIRRPRGESAVLIGMLVLTVMGTPRHCSSPIWHTACGATASQSGASQATKRGPNTPIGYPMVNVRDIESGKIRVTRGVFGSD